MSARQKIADAFLGGVGAGAGYAVARDAYAAVTGRAKANPHKWTKAEEKALRAALRDFGYSLADDLRGGYDLISDVDRKCVGHVPSLDAAAELLEDLTSESLGSYGHPRNPRSSGEANVTPRQWLAYAEQRAEMGGGQILGLAPVGKPLTWAEAAKILRSVENDLHASGWDEHKNLGDFRNAAGVLDAAAEYAEKRAGKRNPRRLKPDPRAAYFDLMVDAQGAIKRAKDLLRQKDAVIRRDKWVLLMELESLNEDFGGHPEYGPEIRRLHAALSAASNPAPKGVLRPAAEELYAYVLREPRFLKALDSGDRRAVVTEAAKKWTRERGYPAAKWSQFFPKKTRDFVADALAKRENPTGKPILPEQHGTKRRPDGWLQVNDDFRLMRDGAVAFVIRVSAGEWAWHVKKPVKGATAHYLPAGSGVTKSAAAGRKAAERVASAPPKFMVWPHANPQLIVVDDPRANPGGAHAPLSKPMNAAATQLARDTLMQDVWAEADGDYPSDWLAVVAADAGSRSTKALEDQILNAAPSQIATYIALRAAALAEGEPWLQRSHARAMRGSQNPKANPGRPSEAAALQKQIEKRFRRKLTASEHRQLDTTIREAREFHSGPLTVGFGEAPPGTPSIVGAAGDLTNLDYRVADKGSNRHGNWTHKAGDHGRTKKKTRPAVLGWVPGDKKRRPVLIEPPGSDLRFKPSHGFVG